MEFSYHAAFEPVRIFQNAPKTRESDEDTWITKLTQSSNTAVASGLQALCWMPNTSCLVAGTPQLADALRARLEPEGPDVELVRAGERVLQRAVASDAGCVVVEDALPDMRGLDLLKRIRSRDETRLLPVIMVSSDASELDRVLAFELGADDFVCKPLNVRELALRLRAVLRRAETSYQNAPSRLSIGPIAIDVDARELSIHGRHVPVTLLEFRLLVDLMTHQGRVRRRDELLRSVWRHEHDLETRTVDTHVKRLREKLGKNAGWIETVRGVGYRFRRIE